MNIHAGLVAVGYFLLFLDTLLAVVFSMALFTGDLDDGPQLAVWFITTITAIFFWWALLC